MATQKRKREKGGKRGNHGGKVAEKGVVVYPEKLPSLIAFDLDDTIWSPEMWLCSREPFSKDPTTGVVRCSGGEKMKYLGDSKAVLNDIATNEVWQNTRVVYVSRTNYPEAAVPLLSLMDVNESHTMADVSVMEWNQIYPANKQTHFSKLLKLSGVPLRDMLFFDNQMDNIRSVSALGVTCVYTPEGLTHRHFLDGLARFAAAGAQ